MKNVMQKMIKSWFSQELNDYPLWTKYKQMVFQYIMTQDTFLRITIYHVHVELLANPKWNTQYSHTAEFLFVREETSKTKNADKVYKLKEELLTKYYNDVEMKIKKEVSKSETSPNIDNSVLEINSNKKEVA